MLRVILADDEQYERNYLEKVIMESYPGLLEIVCKAVDLSLIHIYPGCYDISSAGHVQAGDEFLPSAVRELKEELGIEAREEDLEFAGFRCV